MSAPNDGRPLAYFITFACYGTWLHGDERGSVDRTHNLPTSPYLPANPGRMQHEREAMKVPPYQLDEPRRRLVLDAILGIARQRGWVILAAHVRSNHVHVVVQAAREPERVMNDFKAFASKRLNEAYPQEHGRTRWARHGSTRYLWREEGVREKI